MTASVPAWGTPEPVEPPQSPARTFRYIVVGLIPEDDGDGGTRYRRWIGAADHDDPRAVEDAAREGEPGLLVAGVLYASPLGAAVVQADGYAVFSDPDLAAPED